MHLAPALVGPSDPGVVRAGRQGVRRRDRRGSGRQRARLLRRAGSHHAGAGRRDGARSGQARRFHHPRRGRARHLVLLGAVAVLDAGLARRRDRCEALLSDRRPRHRLRHHLLLGRPHDDDGHALHEGRAVPDGLHPRPRPRREGRQDVEVERQRHRSPASDRRLRRRRAALHAGGDGGAGPRHQARLAARRGLPQFRDQAVECLPLCRNERLRAAGGFRRHQGDANAEPLDRARDRARHARGHRGDRGLSLQRCRRLDLSLRLERVLRLVSRTRKARADGRGGRRQGRNPGHGGVGARRDSEAAAPVHALHHRGIVGGDGQARRPAGIDGMAAQGRPDDRTRP